MGATQEALATPARTVRFLIANNCTARGDVRNSSTAATESPPREGGAAASRRGAGIPPLGPFELLLKNPQDEPYKGPFTGLWGIVDPAGMSLSSTDDVLDRCRVYRV